MEKECYTCGFYDPDWGCGCPSLEPYLCPLNIEAQEDFEKSFKED